MRVAKLHLIPRVQERRDSRRFEKKDLDKFNTTTR